jgi:hypothetical protein
MDSLCAYYYCGPGPGGQHCEEALGSLAPLVGSNNTAMLDCGDGSQHCGNTYYDAYCKGHGMATSPCTPYASCSAIDSSGSSTVSNWVMTCR